VFSNQKLQTQNKTKNIFNQKKKSGNVSTKAGAVV
jgi:hypothetical protein